MSPTSQDIAIYDTFVSTITAAESKRQQASSIYVALISTGYTLIGTVDDVGTIYILIPIIFISLIWWRTIVYFRNLAKAKFSVIETMEMEWQIKPFTDENEKTKEMNQNNKFSIGLTHLEMVAPLFIFGFSILFLLFDVINTNKFSIIEALFSCSKIG